MRETQLPHISGLMVQSPLIAKQKLDKNSTTIIAPVSCVQDVLYGQPVDRSKLFYQEGSNWVDCSFTICNCLYLLVMVFLSLFVLTLYIKFYGVTWPTLQKSRVVIPYITAGLLLVCLLENFIEFGKLGWIQFQVVQQVKSIMYLLSMVSLCNYFNKRSAKLLDKNEIQKFN